MGIEKNRNNTPRAKIGPCLYARTKIKSRKQRPRIDILERRGRVYKSIDSKVQVYTDPVRGMKLEDLERVLDLVDIFQPNFGGIVREPTLKRINFLRGTGKILWTYECAGEVKDMVGV